MPDCEYTILRSTSELENFATSWIELWQQDPEATPFQRPEWLLPWWRHFGQPVLLTVTIKRDQRPLGLLPFYVYENPRSGERQLLLLGAGTSDYLNGVFAPACSASHIQGALVLLGEQAGWDVLYATQLPPHSKLARAMRLYAGSGKVAFEGEPCARMAAVPVEALPQKIRRNAMYYRNRALRLGTLELTMANEATWRESFDDLVRLHTTRWQERGEAGVLADPNVLSWHREAIPLLERSGCLRLGSLRLNTETIGVLYSLIGPRPHSKDAPSGRIQYFYLTAFSTAHEELRPGTLLLALAIEHAAREGIQIIDMLRGDEAYKKIWHLEKFPTQGFSWRPTLAEVHPREDFEAIA